MCVRVCVRVCVCAHAGCGAAAPPCLQKPKALQASRMPAPAAAPQPRSLLGRRSNAAGHGGNARHLASTARALPLSCCPAGSEAFDAVRQLAAALPAPLCGHSLALTAALRLVVFSEQVWAGVGAGGALRAGVGRSVGGTGRGVEEGMVGEF